MKDLIEIPRDLYFEIAAELEDKNNIIEDLRKKIKDLKILNKEELLEIKKKNYIFLLHKTNENLIQYNKVLKSKIHEYRTINNKIKKTNEFINKYNSLLKHIENFQEIISKQKKTNDRLRHENESQKESFKLYKLEQENKLSIDEALNKVSSHGYCVTKLY